MVHLVTRALNAAAAGIILLAVPSAGVSAESILQDIEEAESSSNEFMIVAGTASPPIPATANVIIMDNFIDASLRNDLFFTIMKDAFGGIGDTDVSGLFDFAGVCVPRKGASKCPQGATIKLPVDLPSLVWDRIRQNLDVGADCTIKPIPDSSIIQVVATLQGDLGGNGFTETIKHKDCLWGTSGDRIVENSALLYLHGNGTFFLHDQWTGTKHAIDIKPGRLLVFPNTRFWHSGSSFGPRVMIGPVTLDDKGHAAHAGVVGSQDPVDPPPTYPVNKHGETRKKARSSSRKDKHDDKRLTGNAGAEKKHDQ